MATPLDPDVRRTAVLSAATAERLEATPGCRTSIDSYRNSRGLDSRLLGNLDLEHTIDIARLDRLSSR